MLVGRLNVYILSHLVFVRSDISIVEPEHIEPLVVLKAKIPALLLNIEFLDVANIDTVLEMSNQVGPLQEISELLGMFFVVGTSEEDGDGVKRLPLEILS